jgi:anti-anti-sigma factor
MHITVESHQDYAIIHLRGEFDSYYCPLFLDEVAAAREAGAANIVVNMRMVKFINSTALGAILRVSKQLAESGGVLAISRPSQFSRDIIEKLGLDRVVAIFDSDVLASASFAQEARLPRSTGGFFQEDLSSVLFTPVDSDRVAHFIQERKPDNPVHGHAFGQHWSGVGRMVRIDDQHLTFTWDGGHTSLSPFDMGQFLALGTKLKAKFRLPMLGRGYYESEGAVDEMDEREDGVKLRLSFTEIEETTIDAIRQYRSDMAYLKDELKQAMD